MKIISLAYLSYFTFLLRYRRTAIGPLWLLIGPSLFISLLGLLYAEIGSANSEDFIPHLAIGLTVWTLINGFITGSANLFKRNRAQVIHGAQTLDGIIVVDVMSTIYSFVHQLPIILVVLIIFSVGVDWVVWKSLLGLLVLVANGIWFNYVFGILGARFRDLREIFAAVMRIAFLATPILWMPGQGMKGGMMSIFLDFNPFYHFIEVIRAPLLGNTVEFLSWAVIFSFTFFGFLFAWFINKRFSHLVPFWL